MAKKCAHCGAKSNIHHHHIIPRSEGGIETIDLCDSCHKKHHSENGDFARWGKRGGMQTAKNPLNWLKNLKQYKDKEWDKSYVL